MSSGCAGREDGRGPGGRGVTPLGTIPQEGQRRPWAGTHTQQPGGGPAARCPRRSSGRVTISPGQKGTGIILRGSSCVSSRRDFEGLWEPAERVPSWERWAPGEGQGAGKGVGLRETTAGNPREPGAPSRASDAVPTAYK